MSKLKITREQEEKLKEFEWHTTSKEHAFELYKNKDPLYYGVLTFYNNFTPEQFAFLLCGWYEVEPEYSIGDWVTDEGLERTGDIIQVDYEENKITVRWLSGAFTFYGFNSNMFREATWKEIVKEKKHRFWDGLGRKVNEFKTGDVVTRKNKGGLFEITELPKHFRNCVKVTKNMCDTEELVPLHEIKCLVTPVEQRLDLE